MIMPSTGIDEASGNNLTPKTFALYQNMPNPAAGKTTIDYTTPRFSHIRLKIYDITGREVKTLVDKSIKPGYYSLNWDGVDDLGNKVSSGVYFIRIDTEDFKSTRKMILLR